MSRKSLLRSIFRHTPHNKAKRPASAPQTEQYPAPRPRLTSQASTESLISRTSSPLAYKTDIHRPLSSRPSSSLLSIAEETSSPSSSSASITPTPTPTPAAHQTPSSDGPAYSASQLLPAAIEEAKLATYAHLDTLETALAVLDALDGFSATIATVKGEMLEKKRVCDERLGMIGDVEGMLVGE